MIKKISALIDNSRDISVKEHRAVMLRYMGNKGEVLEHFFLYYIKHTTSEALKLALVMLLDHYKLPIKASRARI